MCSPPSASTWTSSTCSASCCRSWEEGASEGPPVTLVVSELLLFSFCIFVLHPSKVCKHNESNLYTFFCFLLVNSVCAILYSVSFFLEKAAAAWYVSQQQRFTVPDSRTHTHTDTQLNRTIFVCVIVLVRDGMVNGDIASKLWAICSKSFLMCIYLRKIFLYVWASTSNHKGEGA